MVNLDMSLFDGIPLIELISAILLLSHPFGNFIPSLLHFSVNSDMMLQFYFYSKQKLLQVSLFTLGDPSFG